MSDPELGKPIIDVSKIADLIGEQTGITQEKIDCAQAAQSAAEGASESAAKFGVESLTSSITKPVENPDRRPSSITIVSPYSENELSEKKELLKKARIEFSENLYEEHKLHLLSALTFATRVGVDTERVLKALRDHFEQEKKRLPDLANSGIDYQSASYFVEEYIVREIAQRKNLETPESFKLTDERKSFMAALAGVLNEAEKQYLAQYVASTPGGYYISPFYSPVSFHVTTRKGLERQNIAAAIAPQPFKKDLIKNFLSQERLQKEKFLLAMANPYLQNSMPFAALMANEYRVTLQYSPSDKRTVSIREALQEQIGRSYTKIVIGDEPKGLLPLEELAGLIVVYGLRNLPQEGLQSRLEQIIPQVLQVEDPSAKLEIEFPDIRLFFNKREMESLKADIEALKRAIAQPDQIPPIDFWRQVFTKLDKTDYGYFHQIRDRLVSQIYQAGEENHLLRWEELLKAFAVSDGNKRTGDPLILTLVSNHEIGIYGKDGPLCSLVRRDDGQWYPSSYRDRESKQQTFTIEGMSYDELQKMIDNSPFRYQVENVFLREVLRGSINELVARVYAQIKTQVDLEALNKAGCYPNHAALAYREEGPLKDFQYLIGGMSPYGVDIYDSIFFALVRHLYQYGKLEETDLSINAPLTGERVTVRNPLLELQTISFEEIQKRLKETGSDVRIPEITIRKSDGYELRAKAWVYETLLKLKDLGYDAVLGKTMAEEFNRQAARIYVEAALESLGFLPKDYKREKPLAYLRDIQQKIYSKALGLGFEVPLKSGHHLAESLSLPLTWEREKELVDFLRRKLTPQDLQAFYNEVGINDEYFQTRDLVETFLNFPSGWGWPQFDRSNEFPTYQYLPSINWENFDSRRALLRLKSPPGEYAVSTQAQEKFKAAKKTWGEFLEEVKNKSSQLPTPSLRQNSDKILELGNALVAEIDKMSQAIVTDWAEKIITGKMAAVGRDMQKPIEVKTWTDFYEAIRQLMDTARLVLIYRSERGRFGWEVSTDKAELS